MLIVNILIVVYGLIAFNYWRARRFAEMQTGVCVGFFFAGLVNLLYIGLAEIVK